MGIRQLCTFYLEGVLFGVNILDVQEIIRRQQMTRIPLAPTVLCGLINLRGQIVTAIDLRERFAMPPREAGREPTIIVVSLGNELTSLLVDEVGDMIEVADDAFEAPPETVQGTTRELITGVYKLERRLLLELDTRKAITLSPQLFL
jgi:purine-binding chemotaxis protein CheW